MLSASAQGKKARSEFLAWVASGYFTTDSHRFSQIFFSVFIRVIRGELSIFSEEAEGGEQ